MTTSIQPLNIPGMHELIERARELIVGADASITLTPHALRELHEIHMLSSSLAESMTNKKEGSLSIPHGVALPTYDDVDLNQKVATKKEFREHAQVDEQGLEQGWKNQCANTTNDFQLTRLQLILKNFMRPGTPYNGLLMFHGVGLGKSCSAITIAESFPTKKVLILTSPGLQDAFRRQLFDITKVPVGPDGRIDLLSITQCTGTSFIERVPNAKSLDKDELDKKIRALISKRYSFFGVDKFANMVSDLGNDDSSIERIRRRFSNHVIIVDEAHHLRSAKGLDSKRVTNVLSRVLQVSEGIKLILLTATPMFNSATDLLDLLNLLRVNDKRKPISEKEVFDERGGVTVHGSKTLTASSRSYVSFMPGGSPFSFPRQLSDLAATPAKDLPTDDLFGNKLPPSERIHRLHLTCTPMSSLQRTFYLEAAVGFGEGEIELEEEDVADSPNEDKRKGRALRMGQQICNLVYPQARDKPHGAGKDNEARLSGCIGHKGFTTCFEIEPRGRGSLQVSYRGSTPQFLNKPLLSSYAPKIDAIVGSVLACKGVSLIYSRFVYSGALPIAIALEHAGFSRFGSPNILKGTPQHNETRMSYIIVTGSVEVGGNSDLEIAAARHDSNMNGEQIRVIIVTAKASEGVDLRFVRQVHVLEPWYNLQKQGQVLGRASRHCSHALLAPAQRNFTLFLHAIRDANVNGLESKRKDAERETLDLRAYRISESKQKHIDEVQRLIHASSFDCALNEGRIRLDQETRSKDMMVEDCFGVTRKTLGINAVQDVVGKCIATIDGPVDDSTYDVQKHAHGLNKYEVCIRETFSKTSRAQIDDLMSAFKSTPRLDFMSLVLTRMIDNQESVIDQHGRSCVIRHRGVFYVAEVVADGSLDPTVKPRRRLESGLLNTQEASSNNKRGPLALESAQLTVSFSSSIRSLVTNMVNDLGLPTSLDATTLIKKLNIPLIDAVLDRLTTSQIIQIVRDGTIKGAGRAKRLYIERLFHANTIVNSSDGAGLYLREHDGKWYCLNGDSHTLSDCDAEARIDPHVIEKMTQNRVLRSIAKNALVRNERGGFDFRLLRQGSDKKGCICNQTSTTTLQQLRETCLDSLQIRKSTISMSILDAVPKKQLCKILELATRSKATEFVAPRQFYD